MTNINTVILVDENDQAIGEAEKMAAHEQALLHRAFSVFVYKVENNQVHWLIQQRQHNKYHCPGLWTNTCCSHPRPGEETIAAGQRRLQEELGFSVNLQEAGVFTYKAEFDNGLTEYEVDHVLLGEYKNQDIHLNPTEVADIKWLDTKTIETELSNGTPYTPWFRQAFEIAKKIKN